MFYDDGLVDLALNQVVQWHQRDDMNAYGDVTYLPSVDIACRVSKKNRITINTDGEQVTSGAMLTTKAAVEIGDKITIDGKDWIVLNVSAPATLDGKEHRRKVYI